MLLGNLSDWEIEHGAHPLVGEDEGVSRASAIRAAGLACDATNFHRDLELLYRKYAGLLARANDEAPGSPRALTSNRLQSAITAAEAMRNALGTEAQAKLTSIFAS